jgi:hypothetical protein
VTRPCPTSTKPAAISRTILRKQSMTQEGLTLVVTLAFSSNAKRKGQTRIALHMHFVR